MGEAGATVVWTGRRRPDALGYWMGARRVKKPIVVRFFRSSNTWLATGYGWCVTGATPCEAAKRLRLFLKGDYWGMSQ